MYNPICEHIWICAMLSCSVMSSSLWPHGMQPSRLFVHGTFQARILDYLLVPHTKGCCLTLYPSMKEMCSTSSTPPWALQSRKNLWKQFIAYVSGSGQGHHHEPIFLLVLPVGMLGHVAYRPYIWVGGEWWEKMGNSGGMEEWLIFSPTSNKSRLGTLEIDYPPHIQGKEGV